MRPISPNESDDQIVDLLGELLRWVRFQSLGELRRVLSVTLTTENDRRAYELTDGTNNQTQIGALIGISQRAVSYKWESWLESGIVSAIPGSKNLRHLASIKSLGGLPKMG